MRTDTSPEPAAAPTAGETDRRPLRVVVVSAFYSDGMGYTENCFPRALAALGHEVHVVTSTHNVYGNEAGYASSYGRFLGPPVVPPGRYAIDGYTVHRLPARIVSGFVVQRGLARAVRALAPDVVHSLEIASLQTFELAAWAPLSSYRLFCETHQHLSVMRPEIVRPQGALLRKAAYRITRTLPTWLSSFAVERCYAIAPDCAEVAERFYGVPRAKIEVRKLGTDTDLFQPAADPERRAARKALRESLGFAGDDVVCVYTGRFSRDKDPLLVARAVESLVARGRRVRALFVGEGVQHAEIARCQGSTIVPFMKHRTLAAHYAAADVGVWPMQESMSMLDAASAGLPLIVSDRIGEPERVHGNGVMYREGDVDSLAGAIDGLMDAGVRAALGAAGRAKMVDHFSWRRYARAMETDYRTGMERS